MTPIALTIAGSDSLGGSGHHCGLVKGLAWSQRSNRRRDTSRGPSKAAPVWAAWTSQSQSPPDADQRETSVLSRQGTHSVQTRGRWETTWRF